MRGKRVVAVSHPLALLLAVLLTILSSWPRSSNWGSGSGGRVSGFGPVVVFASAAKQVRPGGQHRGRRRSRRRLPSPPSPRVSPSSRRGRSDQEGGAAVAEGDGDGRKEAVVPPPPDERRRHRALSTGLDPTPAETYYIPLPEDDIAFAFSGIAWVDMSSTPMHTLTSIAIAIPGTVIWYDHWEDGYDDDVTAPLQSTTQIWGDGDHTNGCVEQIMKRTEDPADFGYVCTAADADYIPGSMALMLQEENAIALPRDANDVYLDGGDLVQSSFPVGITRGAYPSTPGAALAGACEVFESSRYGKLFYAPVGQDTNTQDDSFTLTEMYVMASEDGTEIKFDGASVANIDRGETHVQLAVNKGNVLEATKDVQVVLVTGDFDSTYETRWYNLLPFEEWSYDYYTPVSSDSSANSVVWIYNPPGNGQITLYQETSAGTNSYNVPDGSPGTTGYNGWLSLDNAETGTRFSSGGGERFFVMVVTDQPDVVLLNLGNAYDWGHPLLPAEMLSSRAVVGWGHGCVDNACDALGSRSVIWVTPVADADVHVDYNGDGTVDATHFVAKLGQLLVDDDADDDMTGAIIYADDPATGDPVKISVVWGVKATLSPLFDDFGYDLGAAVIPIADFSMGAFITLHQDYGTMNIGEISPEDTVKVTIRVTYLGADLPPGSVNVVTYLSPLFDELDYVLGSTEYHDELGNSLAIADDVMPAGNPSPFPLDFDGVPNQFTLKDSTAHTITFLAVVDDIARLSSDSIKMRGHVTSSPEVNFFAQAMIRFTPELTLEVAAYVGHDNGTSCQGAYQESLVGGKSDKLKLVPPDALVTYCYVVTNSGNTALDHAAALGSANVLNDTFSSDWSTLGGPSSMPPGRNWTLVVERAAGEDHGSEVVNAVSVGGVATTGDGYVVEGSAVTDANTVTVRVVGYDVGEILHCESFGHTMASNTDIMHFEFVAHSVGCVEVRVYINDRPRSQTEKDGGALDPDWAAICHGQVQGMGSSPDALTDIPPEYCTPTAVGGGVTKHFFIAVSSVDQEVCDALPAASGENYVTAARVDTHAAGVCIAGDD